MATIYPTESERRAIECGRVSPEAKIVMWWVFACLCVEVRPSVWIVCVFGPTPSIRRLRLCISFVVVLEANQTRFEVIAKHDVMCVCVCVCDLLSRDDNEIVRWDFKLLSLAFVVIFCYFVQLFICLLLMIRTVWLIKNVVCFLSHSSIFNSYLYNCIFCIYCAWYKHSCFF